MAAVSRPAAAWSVAQHQRAMGWQSRWGWQSVPTRRRRPHCVEDEVGADGGLVLEDVLL